MTVYVVFASILVALLAFIAVKLYALEREMGMILVLLRKRRETPEAGAPAQSAAPVGQTINVNLGTGQLAAQSVVNPVAAERTANAEKVDEAATESAGVERERTQEERPKATPAGSFAVKCPKCKAENSVYRTECFNCGASL